MQVCLNYFKVLIFSSADPYRGPNNLGSKQGEHPYVSSAVQYNVPILQRYAMLQVELLLKYLSVQKI